MSERADLLLAWARHRDGALDAAGREALRCGLEADPEARRLVLADAAMDGLLRCRAADADPGERFTAGVATVLAAEADQGRFAARVRARLGRSRRLRRATPRRLVPLFAAAALLAAAVGWWLLPAATGPDLPWSGGQRLAAGAELAPDAPLELRWDDGSSARLAAGSRLSIGDPAGGKRLALATGSVAIEAAHQPEGRPLRIAGAHATATVVGTAFTLAADADGLRLDVARGAVRLDPADGSGLLVAAGGSGLADRFGVRAPGAPFFAWSPAAGPQPAVGRRTIAPDGALCLAGAAGDGPRVAAVSFQRGGGLAPCAPGTVIACRVWLGADVHWAGCYAQDWDDHRSGQWHLPLDRREQWLDLRLPLAAAVSTGGPLLRAGDPVHILMLQAIPASARLLLAELRVEPGP